MLFRGIQYIALVFATVSLLILAFPRLTPLFRSTLDASELVVAPQEIILGTIDQGKTVPFTISLRNSSFHDIHGLCVAPSCGCTLLDPMSNAPLAARTSRLVNGVFNANRTRGKKTSHILVSWGHESQRRQQIVTVEADVTPVITVNPGSLEFRVGNESNDRTIDTKRIHLRSTRNVLFAIDDLRWAHPALEVTIEQSASEEPLSFSTVLDIAFNRKYPNVDALSGTTYVDVITTVPTEPTLRIPVLITPSINVQE